jgi:hypothetical protein
MLAKLKAAAKKDNKEYVHRMLSLLALPHGHQPKKS